MKKHIHFGLVGIKIGDVIHFDQSPDIAIKVGSGTGTPDNGGTLVYFVENRSFGLCPIIGMTRKLMNVKKIPDDFDLWSHWIHKGLSLREIYESNISK